MTLIGRKNYSYSNGRNLQHDTFWLIFCIHTFFVKNSGCLGLTEGTVNGGKDSEKNSDDYTIFEQRDTSEQGKGWHQAFPQQLLV